MQRPLHLSHIWRCAATETPPGLLMAGKLAGEGSHPERQGLVRSVERGSCIRSSELRHLGPTAGHIRTCCTGVIWWQSEELRQGLGP